MSAKLQTLILLSNLMYSTELTQKQVEAWKLRGHLPHAVEATALLTDAILHDDAAHNSVFSIRATYAAAFCRFVFDPSHQLMSTQSLYGLYGLY